MPKYRTKKSDRATYIYKDRYGNVVATLRPGEDGVTEELIAELHAMDDTINNAERRDSYHGLIYYEAEPISEDGDRCIDLPDEKYNPEKMLIDAITQSGYSAAFKAEWDKLSDKQRELIIRKSQGHTNVQIAAEEGCTESAIRNRLSKIKKRFEKKFVAREFEIALLSTVK